ncbi:hypothetical protein [Liberibacter crescens]|nr:hypothetical protein [Liberibacter crescens]
MQKKSLIEPMLSNPFTVSILYSIVSIITIFIYHWPNRLNGYMAASDNDSFLRLVEIRDWLSGQDWFDMTQYRLGLKGGTLMHWSRLIDLIIGSFIMFFSLFMPQEQAENITISIYPLLLIIPIMIVMALAGKRSGNIFNMHLTLVITFCFLIFIPTFAPGSIDHHNIHMLLTATIAAMLLDLTWNPRSFTIAGIAAAAAIVIGAETTPFVIVSVIVVCLLWVSQGQSFSSAARAFGLSLSLSLTLCFFGFISPQKYTTVTCDNFSFGIYATIAISGIGLFVITFLAEHQSTAKRLTTTIILGAIVLITTAIIAPQCIANPMSSLNPELKKLWLDHVNEAQSFIQIAQYDPQMLGVYYIAPLLGILICLYKIIRHDKILYHSIIFALIMINWVISLIEVRQFIFANLLTPLAFMPLITNLRYKRLANPNDWKLSITYIGVILSILPAFWVLLCTTIFFPFQSKTKLDKIVANCSSITALERLSKFPPSIVSAPSNMGAPILRFTRHHVLSGPYHRDQSGLLAQFHIEMFPPDKAKQILKDTGVQIIAICKNDFEVIAAKHNSPNGLYARILENNIPNYIKPIPGNEGQIVKLYYFSPNLLHEKK